MLGAMNMVLGLYGESHVQVISMKIISSLFLLVLR